MIQVSFKREHNDVTLFTLALDVMPRVGEFVSYVFQPLSPDEWSPEVLAEKMKISEAAHYWEVVEVFHQVRQFRPHATSALAVVYVKPHTRCLKTNPQLS